VKIESADTRQQAKVAISAITSGGNTSIGAGLQAAQNQIASNGSPLHPKAIVLLSDGYENTAPWAADVLPTITAAKTVVHTIALGPDSDQNLLQGIASQTGGTYNFSPDANALAAIYNSIIGQVSGQQTLFSTTGSISPGQMDEKTVVVDAGQSETTFSVTWSDPTVNIDLTLRRPNGTIIDPTSATTDPNITFSSGSTFEYYRIRNPVAGTWTMRIFRSSASASARKPSSPQTYTALVMGRTNVSLNFYLNLSTYKVGDPMVLTAVIADQQSILGATVNVVVTIPTTQAPTIEPRTRWIQVGRDTKPLRPSATRTISQTISLYDDGQHSDGAANDGIYANSFTNTTTAGIYTFDLSAAGITNAGTPFTRLASATANVITPPVPNVDVTSSPPARVSAGQSVAMRFNVRNNGNQQDTFNLRVGEVETALGWASTSSIPNTVALYAGQSVSYDVTVSVPTSVPLGSSFTLFLIAISQTDINTSDMATIEVSVPRNTIQLPLILRSGP
jgi:hypothetical protein